MPPKSMPSAEAIAAAREEGRILGIAQGIALAQHALHDLRVPASDGSFGTYLGRLAGPGLITRDREIRLTEEVMGA